MDHQQALFPLVIDHVYVWVPKAVIEAGGVTRYGLIPKPRIAIHDGDGTASQIIYFANMYLELLWVEDPTEFAAVCATSAEPLALGYQWQETGHSRSGSAFTTKRQRLNGWRV